MNLIPPCVAMGEAAGTAGALAVKQGKEPRNLDYSDLRGLLLERGVPLPEG